MNDNSVNCILETDNRIFSRKKGLRRSRHRKMFGFLCTILISLVALTGCMGQGTSITINEDESCVYTLKYLYEKSMFQDMISETSLSTSPLGSGDFTQGEETIGSMTYTTFSRVVSFGSISELKTTLTDKTAYIAKLKEGSAKPDTYTEETISAAPFSDMTADRTSFIATIQKNSDALGTSNYTSSDVSMLTSGSQSSMSGVEDVNAYYKSTGVVMNYSITLPTAVTESNGTISGNTVTWELDALPADGKLIASAAGGVIAADTEPPVISGISEGKLTNKTTYIGITDNVGIKSVTVNGISVGMDVFSISLTGKYTIVATDHNNNQSTLSFRVDTKAPKIKGVKNGKIVKKAVTLKFSDNTGVKSVKINGKNANKKKVKIKKKGKYVVKVTDKAGNKSKISFKIK